MRDADRITLILCQILPDVAGMQASNGEAATELSESRDKNILHKRTCLSLRSTERKQKTRVHVVVVILLKFS